MFEQSRSESRNNLMVYVILDYKKLDSVTQVDHMLTSLDLTYIRVSYTAECRSCLYMSINRNVYMNVLSVLNDTTTSSVGNIYLGDKKPVKISLPRFH